MTLLCSLKYISPVDEDSNLAKIPPQQVIADSYREKCVESESAWCRAGIIEGFSEFKMAAKMAAINIKFHKNVIFEPIF